MKDNLFEMLLNLFELTLTQLKEKHHSISKNNADAEKQADIPLVADEQGAQLVFVRSPLPSSVRVFTHNEQIKLTKASYQFLMRIASWGILASDVFELIMNKINFSESRIVTLQETKWTIRGALATNLNAEQLAFLDLVLYHKEDRLAVH